MKKKLLVVGAISLLAVMLASAALLSYYGRIFTTVEVEQSIQLMGPEGWMSCTPGYEDCTMSDEVWEAAPGGEKFCFKHQLRNRMSINGSVMFETYYEPDGEGVSTLYYEIDEVTTIILENKDSNWAVIADGTQATLTYDTVNPTFDYGLEVIGLAAETEYVLLYYADFDPRFAVWGGDNPGALISTFTTDINGSASDAGSLDLGINLPDAQDWNSNPVPEYCDYNNGIDDYEHCAGAKFWIVPSADYNGVKVTNWNPTAFLFETDLGIYLDCNLGVPEYLSELADHIREIPTAEGAAGPTMDIASGEERDFLVCHGFDERIVPGTYTIETRIV